MRPEAPRVTARMPSADGTRRAWDRSPSSARPRPAARRPWSSPSPRRGPRPRPTWSGPPDPHPRRPGSAQSRFALGNWRVRWRLAALIAVPLLTAAVLGALTINRGVSNWQTTGRVQHLAQLNSAVVKYIQAVEDERDYSVASTANRGAYSARLKTARRVTDAAAAKVATLADGITVGDGYQPAAVQAVNAVQVSAKTPSARPQGGGGPAISHDGNHAGVHRERHPAREHIHRHRRERGQQYRSPARRHLPSRTAPGPRRQVGSAGPPAQGGQFPAAEPVARRPCQPPAGTPAGSGGSGQLQGIRRSRRAAELQQHGDRGAGRYRRHADTKRGGLAYRPPAAPAHPGACAHPVRGKREQGHVVHHRQGAASRRRTDRQHLRRWRIRPGTMPPRACWSPAW